MSKPCTHTGVITAKHSGEQKTVDLRETPKLWITARGTRYRKEDGRIAATWVQTTHLDLASIRPKGSIA